MIEKELSVHVSKPSVAVLAAATLVLTACGAEESDPSVLGGPEGAETPSTEDTGDASDPDGDEPEGAGSGSDAVSESDFAECRAERFTIAYPQAWETNDDDHPACRVFHPGDVELPEHPQDLELHWAAAVYVDDVTWEDARPDEEFMEILSSEETEVDGHRASVHELRSRDEGMIPEGERRYGYAVDLDGQTLVAVTHSVGDTDYERDRDVLDRMMSEVTIHEDRESTDEGA